MILVMEILDGHILNTFEFSNEKPAKGFFEEEKQNLIAEFFSGFGKSELQRCTMHNTKTLFSFRNPMSPDKVTQLRIIPADEIIDPETMPERYPELYAVCMPLDGGSRFKTNMANCGQIPDFPFLLAQDPTGILQLTIILHNGQYRLFGWRDRRMAKQVVFPDGSDLSKRECDEFLAWTKAVQKSKTSMR